MSHSKTIGYVRTPIVNYFELSTTQQENAREMRGDEAMGEMYVDCPLNPDEALPLSNFLRTKDGYWHGVYGQSYFSAYFIFIGRSNDEAIVSFRTW